MRKVSDTRRPRGILRCGPGSRVHVPREFIQTRWTVDTIIAEPRFGVRQAAIDPHGPGTPVFECDVCVDGK